MISREAATEALFCKLQECQKFLTARRTFVSWSDCSPAQQPALYLRIVSNEYIQQKGIPTKLIISYEAAIYAHNPNPTDEAQSIQNELLDLIDAALEPDAPDFVNCTLGGTVSHCWIDGSIETDQGMLGQQTVALIPIKILLNN